MTTIANLVKICVFYVFLNCLPREALAYTIPEDSETVTFTSMAYCIWDPDACQRKQSLDSKGLGSSTRNASPCRQAPITQSIVSRS
ncbi:hypothetical protein CDAR_433181 [Caerostris darwini]|uniref:Secreted protein n=1 Tax=Caerostris darwini TaxID=1538125 RepID=A0AAV4QJT6_9ARAC|nr:hypothetical protein CDAR_433181 [Caerostris darwini]